MTAQSRNPEQTVLAYAQRQLDQARINDKATRPSIRIGSSLSELLGQGDAQAKHRYPTSAQVAALSKVKSVPAYVRAVMQAAHERYCEGSRIVTEDAPGSFDTVPCPHCLRQQQEARFREQLQACGIDGIYLDVDWNDLELLPPMDRLAGKCREIVALLDAGACLLLYGKDTGQGKTQSAMLIGKAALKAGRSVDVVNLGDLALDVRQSYSDRDENSVTEKQAVAKLIAPDLLILDDLGAGETDALKVERRILYLALNKRQQMRKPTIATSNLLLLPPKEELKTGKKTPGRAPVLIEVLGERIFARLQPLTALHFNHGTNFRALPSEVSW